MKKTDCICPNTGCPAHGDCGECTAFHRGNPYCRSEATKKLVDGKIARYGIMK